MANSKGVLLDTSTFLWASTAPENLSASAAALVMTADLKRYVSVATVWEMQIKHALGKLRLVDNADRTAMRYAEQLEAEFLPIKLEHIATLYELQPVHRDPFDRILAAQALAGGLSLISPDAVFRQYSISAVW